MFWEKMRRSDREIRDIGAINSFLSEQHIIRIGFNDNGEIYIVPVNYGYELVDEELVFYFHGAMSGRKYELAKTDPCVGFEIDGKYKLLTSDTACNYSAEFQSVVGNGVLSLVRDSEEKIKGLNCLMRHITGKDGFVYSKEMIESVAVFRLKVKKLSCKAKL